MRQFLLSGAIVFGLCGTAHASTGFTFSISGADPNLPVGVLTNNSTSALLTGFNLTIGDTSYNFDGAYNEVIGGISSFNLITPDANVFGGARDDLVIYSFTGFDPGEMFQFSMDVDLDCFDSSEDYQTVMFNNGLAPNAVATAFFSDQTELSATFPDRSNGAPYIVSARTTTAPVPIAPALPMLAAGLGGLAMLRRVR